MPNEQASGGSVQDPSGVSKDSNQPNPGGEPTKDPVDKGSGQVDYASYQKLLAEKKKLQKEFEKQQAEAEQRKTQELETQQRYKELYESVQTEKQDLENKVKEHETRWQDAIKINAFNETLGETRKIDSKYLGFIDTNKIMIDPETNKVDLVSAQKEVDRVLNTYPEIVKSTITATPPNQAPNSRGTLSYDEWLKLPPDEMKRRRRELK